MSSIVNFFLYSSIMFHLMRTNQKTEIKWVRQGKNFYIFLFFMCRKFLTFLSQFYTFFFVVYIRIMQVGGKFVKFYVKHCLSHNVLRMKLQQLQRKTELSIIIIHFYFLSKCHQFVIFFGFLKCLKTLS